MNSTQEKKNLIVVKGSLLNAKEDYICHQVNCAGVMGAGLALQIKNKYPLVYKKYRYACLNATKDLLGCVQIIDNVVNIFGQRSYGVHSRQTDYNALRTAFTKLHNKLPIEKSLAFPYKFGCGLAGGDWSVVYNLIEECFKDRAITIYKL